MNQDQAFSLYEALGIFGTYKNKIRDAASMSPRDAKEEIRRTLSAILVNQIGDVNIHALIDVISNFSYVNFNQFIYEYDPKFGTFSDETRRLINERYIKQVDPDHAIQLFCARVSESMIVQLNTTNGKMYGEQNDPHSHMRIQDVADESEHSQYIEKKRKLVGIPIIIGTVLGLAAGGLIQWLYPIL